MGLIQIVVVDSGSKGEKREARDRRRLMEDLVLLYPVETLKEIHPLELREKEMTWEREESLMMVMLEK